jgi:hypothetical protein
MALWTDIIEPAELTGYMRASLEDYEISQGSLAQWLPNETVPDISARFWKGEAGLVDEARFRSYDAEIEIGGGAKEERVTIDLPAVGLKNVVSEYRQLKLRNAPEEAMRNSILKEADRIVHGVADRIERTRGVVLNTGRATISQSNFKIDDDFGRDSALTLTAPALWSETDTDALGQLDTWRQLYVDKNGEEPGAILMSRRALSALSRLAQFKPVLSGTGQRPATQADVLALLDAYGLPPVSLYNRRTKTGPVLPDDRVLMLPSAGANQLGATYWGETLSSAEETYGIAVEDAPGLVAAVYRGEQPPHIAEVLCDAIALPVLANANLSLSAKVL